MTLEYLHAAFRRSLPFVLIGMAALGGAGLLYSLLAPRIYQASARVIVEPRTQSFTADQDVMSGLPTRDVDIVDTEVEFLESRSVAARVARDRKLQADPEFGADTFDAAVDEFEDALSIRRVGMTYLIDIAVESRVPERAAALADATALAYTEMQRERKRAATAGVDGLLRERVAGMAGALREAEARVQRFRAANDLSSAAGSTLAEQSAATINDQLATARAAEAAARGELAAAERAGYSLDTANAQTSLGTLRAQQATALGEVSAAESRYGDRHPTYIAARQRLARIDQSIAGETGRARDAVAADRRQRLADLRARAAAASDQRRSLEASQGSTAAGLDRDSRAATQLAELERRAAALRGTYETYLNRAQQTRTQIGAEQADSSVVSAATVPSTPSKPHTGLNVALGLLAGLVGGVSVATALAVLSPHLSTAREIEEQYDLEALPALPTARSAGLPGTDAKAGSAELVRAMLAAPTSAFAEMHKNLLAAIDRPVDGRPNRVIAVTSALPKEGKTTASLCLAAMAAHTGRRTILIDCDQRRRFATRAMTGDPAEGLRDVLSAGREWRSLVIRPDAAGFDILPASPARDVDADAFGGEAFVALLRELREAYDLVLIDTAPVLPIADTRLLVRQVDSVLFVARWRSTSRRAVEAALDILGKAGAPIAGVSLTLVDLAKQARYGYGDPTFYYGKYKDYYAAAG